MDRTARQASKGACHKNARKENTRGGRYGLSLCTPEQQTHMWHCTAKRKEDGRGTVLHYSLMHYLPAHSVSMVGRGNVFCCVHGLGGWHSPHRTVWWARPQELFARSFTRKGAPPVGRGMYHSLRGGRHPPSSATAGLLSPCHTAGTRGCAASHTCPWHHPGASE
jgi:hypothetical protein